jgi:hypothetical protein
MCIQRPERIRYEGEEYSTGSEPLMSYFTSNKIKPDFQLISTDLWRGYRGTWEILDGHLDLIALEAVLTDGSEEAMAALFPHSPNRVFANWFSGTIQIPHRSMYTYSQHRREPANSQRSTLEIEIKNGVVTRINGNLLPSVSAAQADHKPIE